MHKFRLFTPPIFKPQPLDMANLCRLTGKDQKYASMGRHALYHILKSGNISGKILVPAYICDTVLIPISKLGLTPVFYDLDPQDLNPCLESIKELSVKHGVKTILAASMYGNSADLTAIETYCRENGLFLIDDAAQSFGAVLGGRMAGSFGNAGFFSFSPGKPAAGHMGAFYWSEQKAQPLKKKGNWLYHKAVYLDYHFNRLHGYKYERFKVFQLLTLLRKTLSRLISVQDDAVCRFEEPVLGGILHSLLTGGFAFRNRYWEKAADTISNSSKMRLIKPLRGSASPHKLVYLAENKVTAQQFRSYLSQKGITSSNGYPLLTANSSDLPNAAKIDGCVVELPIEDNSEKMEYLLDRIREYIQWK